jgi:hypothetical protein
MSNYSEMQTKDLEELREKLLNQWHNLDNTITQVTAELQRKKVSLSELAVKKNPYYKDKNNVLKITINDGIYFITRLHITGKVIGVDQICSDNSQFLKYYKMCDKSEWDEQLANLNDYFKEIEIHEKASILES